ncbi:MAG: NAD(P)/FAD-dependent oxidoreductase [Actinomycetota bacterium]|nr:NAD(P)/FAD-dependent oxidoreductase [Actinomycetota bacterium]MDH5279159.1 NAD(P)/FAD-dependent oxidoreductase [Actinomycetota bacterium]
MTEGAPAGRQLLVAGGGPVGLFAAVAAARRGFVVTVIEPRNVPVDKACGEGLMPGGLAQLRSIGVDPVGRDFAGIRYLSADGRTCAQASFRTGPGRGVRRTVLHQALFSAAEASGARVVSDRVVDVQEDDGRVTVQLRSGERLAGDYLLAADGLHSPVRRLVGLASHAPGPARFGLRQHFDVAPWADVVEVHWSDRSEAYVTPVADGVVGVALLGGGHGRDLVEELSAFPELSARLAGCRSVDRPLGAGPLRQVVSGRVRGRTLLVGDAAGYVDALTGEGLSVGFASAHAAVRSVAVGRPQAYEAAWRRASRRYRWITRAVLEVATRGPTRRAVVPVAAAWPWAFGKAVDGLA